MLPAILEIYGLESDAHQTTPFGSGLINHTWKVIGPQQNYILQRINKQIFKNPQAIADNLQKLATYFTATTPGYVFAAPLPTKDGRYLVEVEGDYYRLLPFVPNSHTVNVLTESSQAYEAARQFAQFTYFLRNFDAAQLAYTLPDFHNLNLRIAQFDEALAKADADRIEQAAAEIKQVRLHMSIADTYDQIVSSDAIPLRVIHHDTKISNVLFDDNDNGLAVIDLDTVMPGYFFSDVGDMMRTYLSPANEEEQNLDKNEIRLDYFAAIYRGYMEVMGSELTLAEEELVIYSGKFMIFMQGIRFLTDHLNGDIYYATTHSGHNLQRAKNQFNLLNKYIAQQTQFEKILASS